MFWLRLALVLLSLALMPTKLLASAIHIKHLSEHGKISIEIKNSSLYAAILRISEEFNFKIKGLANADRNKILSISLRGDLETILRRLLRNRNYVLVRADENEQKLNGKGPIEKVVLINANFGSRHGIGKRKVPAAATGPRNLRGGVVRDSRLRRRRDRASGFLPEAIVSSTDAH